MIREITGADFQSFIEIPKEQDELAIVQFKADWCGPCRILHKRVEEEYDELIASGKVNFATLNVDNESEITNKYGIRGIPTVLFYRKGELVLELRKSPNLQTIKEGIKVLTTDHQDDF